MHRADGVHFKVAAFTNLTHDHLDYHGDFAAYALAKRRLFHDLSPETSVINVDDPTGVMFAETAQGRVLRCSRGSASGAELQVLAFTMDAHGLQARVKTPAGEIELHSPLVGEHNLENLLVALGCGIALGLPMQVMLHALSTAAGAPGRLERIEHADVSVFVDYAHTPDALERVLAVLRRVSPGRVFCVFGCGGDRDRTKRPRMGRAAATLADIAIATNDNPRGESEAQILEQIADGIIETGSPELTMGALADAARGYLICADRRNAIASVIAAARPGDTVLIAGKGHEKVQIVGSRREPFDDCAEARIALLARGSVF
jgi:UDP-N-acetylmuramoyl-L-alanyl-D-glutamate--2,6-diaminopimelate ligase